MKLEYKKNKRQWEGYSGYDNWMQRDINNADMALVATYHELVPAFEALLEQQKYNLDLFYAEVSRLGRLPKTRRSSALERLNSEKVAIY